MLSSGILRNTAIGLNPASEAEKSPLERMELTPGFEMNGSSPQSKKERKHLLVLSALTTVPYIFLLSGRSAAIETRRAFVRRSLPSKTVFRA